MPLCRCAAYAAAGADAVLVRSEERSAEQILEFVAGWDGAVPVITRLRHGQGAPSLAG